MGKKPVLGLVGVCWITLAFSAGNGCNCCNRQYNPKPAWGKGFDGKPVKGPAAGPDGTPPPQPLPNQQTPPTAPPTAPPTGATGSTGFNKPPLSSQQGAQLPSEGDNGTRINMNAPQNLGPDSAIRLTGATVPANTDPSVSSISSRPSYDVPSGNVTSLPPPRTTSYPPGPSSISNFGGASEDLNGRAPAAILPAPPPPTATPSRLLPPVTSSPGNGLGSVSDTMVPVAPASAPTPIPLPVSTGGAQRGFQSSQPVDP